MHTLPDSDTAVTVGVDTHGDQHVAVALDQLGRHLGATEIPTTRAGYADLVAWASQFGTLDRFGVEGTGSFGAGLARWLRGQGLVAIEIDRPDRKARRRGKSDLIDAEAAARAVLAGTATTVPKRADGDVEMIRVLRVTRRSAVKAQGQAGSQLRGLLVTAPDDLRDAFRGMTTRQRARKAARLRPGPVNDVTAATKLALRRLARRWVALDEEIKQLDAELTGLVEATAPKLVARRGISTHTAATLLVAAGDNPHRLRSEGSFAHLTGAAPLDASSGKQQRHRLNPDLLTYERRRAGEVLVRRGNVPLWYAWCCDNYRRVSGDAVGVVGCGGGREWDVVRAAVADGAGGVGAGRAGC